ncbi:MAG: TRAP transporter small permease subunit [Gammaproteobacteria bacterium]|nr:TRAP transporter small permease subunit [Gammaproteobacteria bacterium]
MFAGWLTAVLVLVVVFDVVTRYVFNFSIVAMQEGEWHVYSLIFLLGAGWALKEDRHVRVDIFYTNQSPRVKAWINIIGTLIFLLPFSALAFFSSVPYFEASLRTHEGSPDPGGLPGRWVLKGAILLGFLLLFLQGIAELIKAARFLAGKNPEYAEKVG